MSKTPQRCRATTLLASTLVTGLLLAACGGDDDSAGGSIEDWCAYAAEAEVVDAVFDGFSTGGDVEAGVGQVRSIVDRIDDLAPAEIADDAAALKDGTLRLLSAIEDADYSLFDADLSFMAEDGLEERMDNASENIDAFTLRECGRAFGTEDSSSDDSSSDDSSDDDDSFDPAAGSIRDQLLAQFEAIGLTADESSCIADNLDFTDPALQEGDISAVFDVFSTCNIPLERLAEIGAGG